jgi:hypothetical protein
MIEPGDPQYNPLDTPMFRALANETTRLVERDRDRGIVYEPKSRWDEHDQAEFDTVPLETLLDDPYYGGGRYYVEQIEDETREIQGLWPVHRQDIIDLWHARHRYGTDTFIDIEGIGSGKTHKFRSLLRLDVMQVLTRAKPMEYYRLDPDGQGISFVCMSRNAKLARKVTFTSVLKAFDCPFFNTYFPPQCNIAKIEESQKYPSELRFPKDVVIFPGSGSALSAIGYNLMGGGIDEANYLEVVEGSKKAVMGQDYDAAEVMYSAIYGRMKSRFVAWKSVNGRLPGLLTMFSNTRHGNDFLERMAKKSRTDRKIFFRRRCTWDGHPREHFSGKTFLFDKANRCIVDAQGKPVDHSANASHVL